MDPNYTISYVAGRGDGDKAAPLTITASSGSMTYGGSVPTITPLYSGFMNGDNASSLTTQPTCSTTATSSSPASGSTYPSSCSGAADPNYTISYVAGAVTVNKAPLTITASSGSMTYGGHRRPSRRATRASSTVTALVADHAAHVLDRRPRARARSRPPTYPSSCSGAVDPNYAISYVAGHGHGEQGAADGSPPRARRP